MGPLAAFLFRAGLVAARYAANQAFNPPQPTTAVTHRPSNDGTTVPAGLPPDDPRRLQEIELYGSNPFSMAVGLMAKLAKVDGVVSKEEVRVVERIFATFCGGRETRQQAVAVFQAAKDGVLTYSDLLGLFELHTREREGARQELIFMLLRVAHANGNPPPARSVHLIENACTVLGLNYQQHLAALPAWCQRADRDAEAEAERIKAAAQAEAEQLKLAYEVLGCQPADGHEHLKHRYRQLVRDFHPDTIAGKGLSPEFTRFAEEKFKQIQAAYEFIVEQRR